MPPWNRRVQNKTLRPPCAHICSSAPHRRRDADVAANVRSAQPPRDPAFGRLDRLIFAIFAPLFYVSVDASEHLALRVRRDLSLWPGLNSIFRGASRQRRDPIAVQPHHSPWCPRRLRCVCGSGHRGWRVDDDRDHRGQLNVTIDMCLVPRKESTCDVLTLC